MPALYSLAVRRLLPDEFAVVGAARSEESDEQFRERMKEAVHKYARDEFDQEVWDGLAGAMYYTTLDFSDGGGEDRLAQRLTASTAPTPIASTTSPSRRARSGCSSTRSPSAAAPTGGSG
jgi:glucose-6-phosphate 1-dehydrogenase